MIQTNNIEAYLLKKYAKLELTSYEACREMLYTGKELGRVLYTKYLPTLNIRDIAKYILNVPVPTKSRDNIYIVVIDATTLKYVTTIKYRAENRINGIKIYRSSIRESLRDLGLKKNAVGIKGKRKGFLFFKLKNFEKEFKEFVELLSKEVIRLSTLDSLISIARKIKLDKKVVAILLRASNPAEKLYSTLYKGESNG